MSAHRCCDHMEDQGLRLGYCEGLLLHCSHLVMRPMSCTPSLLSATARNEYVSAPHRVHSSNLMLPGDSSKRAILSIAWPVYVGLLVN